jgi:hypothetical protein
MSEFEAQVPSAQDGKDRLDARRREGRFARLAGGDPLRRYLRFSDAGRVPPRDIITAVEDLLIERYGPPRAGRLPAGLRLEMHPSVARWFMVSDDDEIRHARNIPGDLFTVPVLVTVHLPENRWRLLIVTEEVLIGGGIYISPPGDEGAPVP